jgi:hypothetical protein
MLNLNGVIHETIDSLETAMTALNLSNSDKQALRNEFNGVPNNPVHSIAPVTNQQLRTALVNLSNQQNKPELHPNSISAFIQTLPEPNKSIAIQSWEYSNEMKRDNPLVNSMSPLLGLTSTDLDNLWTYARTLT